MATYNLDRRTVERGQPLLVRPRKTDQTTSDAERCHQLHELICHAALQSPLSLGPLAKVRSRSRLSKSVKSVISIVREFIIF